MHKLSLCIFLLALALCPNSKADISHIEFGAANYNGNSLNEKRFLILEQVTQDLIAKHGSTGIIYLNDIAPEGLELASKHLKSWLLKNGFDRIQVITLPGNYNEIELPNVLTANLSNPEGSQLPHDPHSAEDQLQTTRDLERLASKSSTGLKITTYFSQGKYNFMSNLKRRLTTATLVQKKERVNEYFDPSGTAWKDFMSLEGIKKTKVFVLRSIPEILCTDAFAN